MLDLTKAEVSVKPAKDASDSAPTTPATIRVGVLVTRLLTDVCRSQLSMGWEGGTRGCQMNIPLSRNDRSGSHSRLNQLKIL